MRVHTRDITIKGLDANGVLADSSAKLIVCPECESEEFLAYLTGDAGHLHLQRIGCGASYCDGQCAVSLALWPVNRFHRMAPMEGP
jgi:hypothetical protein